MESKYPARNLQDLFEENFSEEDLITINIGKKISLGLFDDFTRWGDFNWVNDFKRQEGFKVYKRDYQNILLPPHGRVLLLEKSINLNLPKRSLLGILGRQKLYEDFYKFLEDMEIPIIDYPLNI